MNRALRTDRRTAPSLAAAAAIGGACLGAWATPGAEELTVAIPFDTPIAGSGGALIGDASTTAVLDNGDLLVSATLDPAGAGVSPSNDSALLLVRGGVASVVAREGDLASGVSDGAVWSGAFIPAAAPGGTGVFRASLAGGSCANPIANAGLWSWDGVGTALMVRGPVTVPGLEPLAFGVPLLVSAPQGVSGPTLVGLYIAVDTSTGLPALNEPPQYVYSDGVTPFAPVQVPVLTTDEGLMFVPGDGAFNPGAPPPGTIRGAYLLGQTGVSAADQDAVFRLVGGTYHEVMREGDVADGYADAEYLGDSFSVLFERSDGSAVVFGSVQSPAPGGVVSARGYWAVSDAGAQLLAGEEIASALLDAPDVTAAISYVRNDRGDLALVLQHQFTPTNWAAALALFPVSGPPEVLFEKGDPLPGTSVTISTPHGLIGMNNHGDLLFRQQLPWNPAAQINPYGYWLLDGETDQIRAIAIEAELFDFSHDRDGSAVHPIESMSPNNAKLTEDRKILINMRADEPGTSGLVVLDLDPEPAPCPADIDGDGDADPDDIAAFVTNFTDAIPGNADIDNDGDEDPDDIAAFVNAFVAGC